MVVVQDLNMCYVQNIIPLIQIILFLSSYFKNVYPLSSPTEKQEVKGPTMKHQFQQSSLKRTGSIFYSFFVFKICSSLKGIILNDTKVYICICCAGSQRVSFFFDLSSKLFSSNLFNKVRFNLY